MFSLLHYWCKLCVGSCCLRVAMRWLMRSVSQLTPWHMKDQVVHLDQLSLCRLHPSMFFYWPTLNVHLFDVAVKKKWMSVPNWLDVPSISPSRCQPDKCSPLAIMSPPKSLDQSIHGLSPPQRLQDIPWSAPCFPEIVSLRWGHQHHDIIWGSTNDPWIWGSTMGDKNILWIGQGDMSGGQMAKI